MAGIKLRQGNIAPSKAQEETPGKTVVQRHQDGDGLAVLFKRQLFAVGIRLGRIGALLKR